MADEVKDEQIAKTVALIEDVWANPKARPYIEEAIHIAKPEADLPGRAARLAGQSIMAEVDKRNKEIDGKIADFSRQRDLERAHNDLAQQGFTPADIQGIEKLMVDEGIGTHANAAVVYQARTQVAPPRGITLNGMSPTAYGRGAHADYFRGIMDGDFHAPGQAWAHSKIEQISQDFAKGENSPDARRWLDPNWWPADRNFPAPKA